MRKRFTMVEKIASSNRIKMHKISESKFKAKRKMFKQDGDYVLKLGI